MNKSIELEEVIKEEIEDDEENIERKKYSNFIPKQKLINSKELQNSDKKTFKLVPSVDKIKVKDI